jgi:hypothetical protein
MTESSGRQNRLFLIVVVGLVALLMIGMVSIAGLVVYTRFLAPSATPTVVAQVTPSVAPTVAATATRPPAEAATPTPEGGVPTPTRVIQEGTPPPEGPTPTATKVPVEGDDMPETGFGPLEAVVGGLALILIILIVRRVRLRPGT